MYSQRPRMPGGLSIERDTRLTTLALCATFGQLRPGGPLFALASPRRSPNPCYRREREGIAEAAFRLREADIRQSNRSSALVRGSLAPSCQTDLGIDFPRSEI